MTETKKIYEKHFDSLAYIERYVSQGCAMQWIVEDFYHSLFAKGKLHGKTLLDVGCGPTVRAAISASAHVSEIYLSEFLQNNRQVVQDWLRKDAKRVDFSAQFKHVAALEGNQQNYQVIEERTRSSIKGVYHCDILSDNPLHPRPAEQFDIVFSSLCIDAYPKEKDYFKAMKNLSSLVRPGGHLGFISSYKGKVYTVGDYEFEGMEVDEDKIGRAMAEAKLDILELNKHSYSNEKPVAETDNEGFLSVLAVKV